MPSTPSKNDLRTTVLKQRDALSIEQRNEAAQVVASREFPVYLPPGAVVSGYSPIRSEFDPVPLMKMLAAHGVELALPVIVGRGQPLAFRAWTADAAMARGAHGIFEPLADAEQVQPDIVLVPLAAFDRAGHRIGYGAGYYDRTLIDLRRSKPVTAIGLAFAAQEIPEVPADDHDVRLDLVLTEARAIDFRS